MTSAESLTAAVARLRQEIAELRSEIRDRETQLARAEAELDMLLGLPPAPSTGEDLRRLRLAVAFGKHKPAWVP